MHTKKQGGEKCQTEVFFMEILQGAIFFTPAVMMKKREAKASRYMAMTMEGAAQSLIKIDAEEMAMMPTPSMVY